MNNIQELIKELEEQKEKAGHSFRNSKYNSSDEAYNFGKHYAFSVCIDKLTLLLNAEAETNGEKDCKNDGNAV